jgi:peroxiredoxin
MPYLQQTFNKWSGEKLVFLTINGNDSISSIQDFFKQNGYSMPVLLDSSGNVEANYGVYYYPATILIDRNGIVRDVMPGPFRNAADIDSHLKKIIN